MLCCFCAESLFLTLEATTRIAIRTVDWCWDFHSPSRVAGEPYRHGARGLFKPNDMKVPRTGTSDIKIYRVS